jgi:hypothetical protein
MKKLTIAFSLLILTGTVLHAQDLKKARTAYNLTLLPNPKPESVEGAKTEIDKLMNDPKTSGQAESHLLKMQIYGKITADSTLFAKYPQADVEAFTALKKYIELEPSEEKLKADKYDGINNIYNSFFKKGVKYYQAEDWSNSFDKFKLMAEMGDLLIARKWSNSPFDTTSYLYAAATAQNAKKEDEAAKYYAGLANLKVAGKDYQGVYEYLTKYYLTHPNEAEFKKYIGYAKELYPTNDLWKDLEFEYTKSNSDVSSILAKFDAADAAKTMTSTEYFDYGNYFVTDKKIKDLDEAKKADFTRKATYAFTKAYEMDTTNGIAAYNAGITNYTTFETVADSARAIKGTTADVKAKKTAANKSATDAADKAVEWLEKAFNSFSAKKERTNLEKGLLNKSIDLLYNVYEYKRDMSRGVNPKDYDKYDAKLTYYNGLHGKF